VAVGVCVVAVRAGVVAVGVAVVASIVAISPISRRILRNIPISS